MRASENFSWALILSLSALAAGCKKDITQQEIYSNVVYEVNPVEIYESNAEKNKQKSPEQFISLLYSDLFNETISGDALNNLAEIALSFGDKGLINTMLLENALNSPALDVPTNEEMRSNLPAFVEATYLRFYLRYPSEYEKHYFISLVEGDAGLTPELIYAAFAQSNEYLFY
jgi:hypothetical protein